MNIYRARSTTLSASLFLAMAVIVPPARAGDTSIPPARPDARLPSLERKLQEASARFLQSNTPMKPFELYLVGFHPMKDRPDIQMEAHHYCHQVNEDFAQCVLFDGNTKDANLNGVEYIISEKLFETLPAEEKKYWHPHNGEILSGQLVAPGIPEAAERSFMEKQMNSYGKTWHFWNTGGEHAPRDRLPLGDPSLGWSFNREGEAQPGLIEARDRKLKVDSNELRRKRTGLEKSARPQSGVDALKDKFDRSTRAIPGVVDKGEAKSRSDGVSTERKNDGG